ncbi:MAG: hypothetical protein ACE5KV_06620 [Thermoplasmata archaeon]
MERKVAIRKSTWDLLEIISAEEDETVEETVNRLLSDHLEEYYGYGDEGSSNGESEELDLEDIE